MARSWSGSSFDEGTFSRPSPLPATILTAPSIGNLAAPITLGNDVSFTEGGDAVVLDDRRKSSIPILRRSTLAWDGGASVMLARSGSANTGELFGASGSLNVRP